MTRVLGRVGLGHGRTVALGVGVMVAITAAMAPTAGATPGVAGWGSGEDGQLGNGSAHNAATFAPVSLITEVSSVAAGGNFTLALLDNGTVMSWGSNAGGQLGIGTSGGRAQTPVAVDSLSGVAAISAGGEDALALLGDGTVAGWGSGESGVPGSRTPKKLDGISGAVAVAAGSEDKKVPGNGVTDLALLGNGKVLAWGNGEDGQLGNGKTENSTAPVEVSGLTDVTAIAAGDGQNLALLADGTVMAWGENNAGQLGNGNLKSQDQPIAVQGISDVVAIAAGDEDCLALLADGTVMAWGNGDVGQLGRPPVEGNSDIPVAVAGLDEVAAVAAGTRLGVDINGTHNVALLDDGTVMTWGGNKEGQLGDGTEGGSSFTPVQVSGLTDVTGIAGGASDSFAVGPPVPVVTNIEPASGSAGTLVRITGVNLGGAGSVSFGSGSTTEIQEDTSVSLVATAPPEKPGNAAVSVTTPFGTSGSAPEADFRYVPQGTVAFGRCLKLAKHSGQYKKGCTELAPGGGYEWASEIVKRRFTLASKKPEELVASSGALVVCNGVGGGGGEYSSAQSVANLTITFTECGVSKSKHATKCNSPGAAAGEIRTATLEGVLGFQSRAADTVALELFPAEEGTAFLSFTCGASETIVRGATFSSIGQVGKSTDRFSLALAQSKGKQHVEHFEGGASEVLEASVAGGPFAQVALSDAVTLTSEEAIEINPTL